MHHVGVGAVDNQICTTGRADLKTIMKQTAGDFLTTPGFLDIAVSVTLAKTIDGKHWHNGIFGNPCLILFKPIQTGRRFHVHFMTL